MIDRPLRPPWKVERLPSSVTRFPALVFLLSAGLKPFAPNYLCSHDPWESLNAVALPLELLVAWVLLLSNDRARRSLAALTGFAFTAGALAVLTAIEFLGPRYQWAAYGRSCGCFGPIELPFAAHIPILLAMTTCFAVTWFHEEAHRVPAEDGSSRAGAG